MNLLRYASACVFAGALAGLGASPALAQWAKDVVVRPQILAEIPHDTAAFTQGLLWLDGRLYESTGLYGASSLRELDPKTGAVTRRAKVPAKYFAEGLAWYRGEFVQLTWQEGEALRWPRSFGKSSVSSGTLRYAGEGWGLATLVTKTSGRPDTALWMSNGSDTLIRREVSGHSLKPTRKTLVRLNGRPVERLNELEGARGKVVANVWYSDSLVVVDPASGKVVAVVDGTELAARSGRRNFHDVLNGVAWDPAKDEFYLTGKNWPKMFRVKIPGF